MRRTDQQIIAQIRELISQTDSSNSDFSDSELLGFANEGVQFIAQYIEWPRDLERIQVESGKPAYTLANDTQKIRTAYFGDQSVSGEPYPLIVLAEEQLKERVPTWISTHSSNSGRPNYAMLLDRRTVLLNPTPDSDNSATGKYLWLGVVYYPAAMTGNGTYPDLPSGYHDLVKIHAGYLCYLGKLKNPDLALKQQKALMEGIKLVQSQVAEPQEEKFWGWGNFDSGLEREASNNPYRF